MLELLQGTRRANHQDTVDVFNTQYSARPATPGTVDARRRLVPWQAFFLLFIGALIVWALCSPSSPQRTLVIGIWIALYTFNNLYRYWLAAQSVLAVRAGEVVCPAVTPLADDQLPAYTILLPLRHEAPVVPQLMGAIRALDYPPEKLQVLCLLRPDDEETLAALAQCGVSERSDLHQNAEQGWEVPVIEVLLLPPDLPVGTKPAACNWGLAHARGEVLVIYDAEDIPEPAQLRQAAAALCTLPADVACVQSSKKVYNGATNWLTRLYELEALTWHRLQLPGVMAREKMSPLHGSGVHFRIEVLRELNGWDFYNVAEDCDLGVRLARRGYRIAPIASLTGEEAPHTLRGWMGQRTRWNKGYVQSFLVHTRQPRCLLRELGFRRALSFVTLTGITFLNLLIGLPTWLGALLWGALSNDRGASSFLASGDGSTCDAGLLIGSAIVLLLMAALLQGAGAVVSRQWKLLPYSLLIPVYWVLLGIAVWRSMWQLIITPFGWEKTDHGKIG
jgi:cellulose synthase/poly-beta-1,6-N-acetylglucosamine synthase-like glycosyltransferase